MLQHLWTKFLLLFLGINILWSLCSFALLGFSLHTRFERYAFDRDDNSANMVARDLSEVITHFFSLTELTEQEKWQGIGESLNMVMLPGKRPGTGMRRNMPGMSPGNFELVITDLTGNVQVSMIDRQRLRQLMPLNPDRGVPLYNNQTEIGRLYLGKNLDPKLTSLEEDFLSSALTSSLFSLAIAMGFSILISYLFFRHIIRPIKNLSALSLQVEKGVFETINLNNRMDELGVLSRNYNSMIQTLKQDREWKRQIVADTAHELRTPVTLIQGQLEMVASGVAEPTPERLKMLYEETCLLTRLIEDLQTLHNAEGDYGEYNMSPVNLAALLREGTERFSAEAQKKGVQFKLAVSDSDAVISGDHTALLRVIYNLIKNALNYTGSGTFIELGLKKAGTKMIIWIQDQGPGIPVEERQRVFERFYKIDSSRNKTGSGLGLAIACQIIQSHGGTIQIVDSKEGTRFEIMMNEIN